MTFLKYFFFFHFSQKSKVKFGHMGFFVWEKGKMVFSQAIVVYDIKVDICSQLNDFYKY